MPIYVRDASTWRHLNEVVTNDGGTNRLLTSLHANDNGTWRQVHIGNPIIRTPRGPTNTNAAFVSTTDAVANTKPAGAVWFIGAQASIESWPIIEVSGGVSIFRLYLVAFTGDLRPTAFSINDVVGITLKTANGASNIFTVGDSTPGYTKGYGEFFLTSPNTTVVVWSWLRSGTTDASNALNALTSDSGGSVDRILEINWANVTP